MGDQDSTEAQPFAAYQAWAEYHAKLFARTTDEDLARYLEWADVFAFAGYAPGELAEASRWLLANGPRMPYPSDQIDPFREQLRTQRAEANRLHVEPQPDQVECKLCGGCGWVIVPHPKTLDQPVDAACWYSTAVLCRCPLGIWIGHHQDRPQTLSAYEYLVPEWRKLVRGRETYLKRLHKVRAAEKRS